MLRGAFGFGRQRSFVPSFTQMGPGDGEIMTMTETRATFDLFISYLPTPTKRVSKNAAGWPHSFELRNIMHRDISLEVVCYFKLLGRVAREPRVIYKEYVVVMRTRQCSLWCCLMFCSV